MPVPSVLDVRANQPDQFRFASERSGRALPSLADCKIRLLGEAGAVVFDHELLAEDVRHRPSTVVISSAMRFAIVERSIHRKGTAAALYLGSGNVVVSKWPCVSGLLVLYG